MCPSVTYHVEVWVTQHEDDMRHTGLNFKKVDCSALGTVPEDYSMSRLQLADTLPS
jgi:hypothetical protein